LACQDPSVTELWVTHQEPLARLGVGIIEELLSPHGGRVVAIGEDEALSDSVESELVQDMLAVVNTLLPRT
jgi:predicted site-specific integrase-resolvase